MDAGAGLRKELLDFLLEKSISKGDFVLSSGKKSDLYVNCRATTLDPHGAILVGKVGLETLVQFLSEQNLTVEAIGGMTLGADPISLAIGMESARSQENPSLKGVFSVRKEPKAYGQKKRIEGCFENGNRVIVVDDVITTGGSTLQAIEAIRQEGGEVIAALILVDREEGGRAAIEAAKVPVISIFRRSELI